MKYSISYGHASFRRNTGFIGKGSVYITENSLIFEGYLPKYRILIFSSAFRKVLGVSTMRTIPYAVIQGYTRWLNYRRIVYHLPNGKRLTIAFKFANRRDVRAFTTKLEEYRTIIQSLYVRS